MSDDELKKKAEKKGAYPFNKWFSSARTKKVYAGPPLGAVYAGPSMAGVYAGPPREEDDSANMFVDVYAGPEIMEEQPDPHIALVYAGPTPDNLGEPVMDIAFEDQFICPDCQSKIENPDNFCPVCGKIFRQK